MQLNIQNLKKDTVEVQGQTVTIAFAEGVMLSGLIAGCGKNDAKQGQIISQYIDAGLATGAFPDATSKVLTQRRLDAEYTAKMQAEAEAHAVRHKSYQGISELEVARRKAKRELLEQKHRDRGAAIRAANGNSTWNSWE